MKTILRYKIYLYAVILSATPSVVLISWASPLTSVLSSGYKYQFTLLFPVISPIVILTPFFLMRRSYVRQLRLYDGKLCTKCGYTLDIESDHKPCPECGVQVDLVAFRAAWLKAVGDWPKPSEPSELK